MAIFNKVTVVDMFCEQVEITQNLKKQKSHLCCVSEAND